MGVGSVAAEGGLYEALGGMAFWMSFLPKVCPTTPGVRTLALGVKAGSGSLPDSLRLQVQEDPAQSSLSRSPPESAYSPANRRQG